MNASFKFEKAVKDLEAVVKFCKKNNIKISITMFDDEDIFTGFNGTTHEMAETIVSCGCEDAAYETALKAAYLIALNELPINNIVQSKFVVDKTIN